MSSTCYDEFVTNFDLSHLSTTDNVQPKELNYEKLRRTTRCLKSKIISTDFVIQEYIAKTEDYNQAVKAHFITKEDLKQSCINYKNLTEKCTELENENKVLIGNQGGYEKRVTDAENNYSALISYTNQLQSLVKELETKKEALTIEKKLEKSNDGKVQALQKEKEVLLSDILALRDVVLGKKKKGKRHMKILKAYAKHKDSTTHSSDESADEIITYKGPSHGKPRKSKIKLHKNPNSISNLKSSNIDIDSKSTSGGVDTGFGSSHENSDGKCQDSLDIGKTHNKKACKDLNEQFDVDCLCESPESKLRGPNTVKLCAFELPAPLFEDLYDNNEDNYDENYIIDQIPVSEEIMCIEESRKYVNACTSPVPDHRLFVNKATSPRKSLLVDACTSPAIEFSSKRVCDKCTNTEVGKIIDKTSVVNACTNTDFVLPKILHTLDRGTSPIHYSESENTKEKNRESPKKPNIDKNKLKQKLKEERKLKEHNLQQSSTQEKICLESHNSNSLSYVGMNDDEIQNILNVMSLHHDLISPIPKSPHKIRDPAKDISNALSNIHGTLSDLVTKFNSLEGQVGDIRTQYNNVKEDVTAIRNIIEHDNKHEHGDIIGNKNSHKRNEISQVVEKVSNPDETISHSCNGENAGITEDLSKIETPIKDLLSITKTTKQVNTEVSTNEPNNNKDYVDPQTNLVRTNEERIYSNEQQSSDNVLNDIDDTIDIPQMNDHEIRTTAQDHIAMTNTNETKANNITIVTKLKKKSKLEKFRNKLIPTCKIKQIILPNAIRPVLGQKIITKDTSSSLKHKIAYENAVKVMTELKSKKALQETMKHESISSKVSECVKKENRTNEIESSSTSVSLESKIVSTRCRTANLSKNGDNQAEILVNPVVLLENCRDLGKHMNCKGRKRSADEMEKSPGKRVLRSSNVFNATNKINLPVNQVDNGAENIFKDPNTKTSESEKHANRNIFIVRENENSTTLKTEQNPNIEKDQKNDVELVISDPSCDRRMTGIKKPKLDETEYCILPVKSDTLAPNVNSDENHLEHNVKNPVGSMPNDQNSDFIGQVSVGKNNNLEVLQKKPATEFINHEQSVCIEIDTKGESVPQTQSVNNNPVFVNDKNNVKPKHVTEPHVEPNKSLLLCQNKQEVKFAHETAEQPNSNLKKENTQQPNINLKKFENESTTKDGKDNTTVHQHIKPVESDPRIIACNMNFNNSAVEKSPSKRDVVAHKNNVIDYNDLDLYTTQTNLGDSDQNICSNGNPHFKENILCAALDRYGVISVKYAAKKVPETITNSICETIESGITNVITTSKDTQKTKMNELVFALQNFKKKHLLSGLMQYLKEPTRKFELFSKVTNTPAPPMTKAEVILLYVIEQLNKLIPSGSFIHQVWSNIEHALFQLNRTPHFDVLESMSHFYAVMCRYFRDKSRLRCFMLDAMYCLQFKAVPLIRQCLDVCPGVLPGAKEHMAKTSLVTCLVYLLHFYKCQDKFNRAQDIRTILYRKYSYRFSEWNETIILDIFRKALMNLGGTRNDKKMLRLALIILCKRHGAKWCQANIIQNMLLPIIEKRNVSGEVKQFCVLMLGPLLKPFPADKKALCEIIINQLLQMLKQNPSHDMQEAIYSSLIFMSKHNQETVVQALLEWNPERISQEFEEILNDYVMEKPLATWKKLVTRKSTECT